MENGVVSLIATLGNSCGQTIKISKQNISVGIPYVTTNQIFGGNDNVSVNSQNTFNVDYVDGATEYYWFISTINTECSDLTTKTLPRFYSYSGYSSTFTSSTNKATINWGECPGTYVVNCRAVNNCGTTDISYRVVEVFGYDNNPCPDEPTLQVYPNPVNDGSFTVNRIPPGDSCDEIESQIQQDQPVQNEAIIYDLSGNVAYKGRYNTNRFKIKGLNLKSGNYILSVISSNGKRTSKTIIVQ